MKGFIDVKDISEDGDIILSKKNFDMFVEENNLPKFRKKHEGEYFIYRTMFTVFDGRLFFSETEETKKPHV